MAVNKVDYSGDTLIDLTNDTVTADTLSEGVTAHGADGEPIVGTMTAVQYGKAQSLTAEQKALARTNISAASVEKVNLLNNTVNELQAVSMQQTPLFADSIEKCTDTSKVYVLPDGYIYGFVYAKHMRKVNLNVDSVYEYGRFASNGSEYNDDIPIDIAVRTANYIPVEGGKTIVGFYESAEWNQYRTNEVLGFVQYDENKQKIGNRVNLSNFRNGDFNLTLDQDTKYIRFSWVYDWNGISIPYDLSEIKISIYYIEDAVRDYIDYVEEYAYAWTSTGHQFIPAGFESNLFAPIIKVTSAGNEITDAAGGQAASVVVSLSPKLEDGSLAPNPTGGRFAPWKEASLNVNGVEMTVIVDGRPYAGTVDAVSGKTEATGVRLYQATDLFRLHSTTAPGTSSAGVKYIRVMLKDDVASLDFINLLVACNRYEARTDSPYDDKTIRVNSNAPYIYDNDIDFDNPLAILDGVEFLLSDGTAETFSGIGWPVVLEQGNNTITSDSGDVTVTYGIDTKTYIDRKFAELSAALLGG